MRNETSDDISEDTQEAQPGESAKPISEDTLKKGERFPPRTKEKGQAVKLIANSKSHYQQ